MTFVDRLRQLWTDLPVVHKVVIGVAGGLLVLGAVLFGTWVTQPSYTLLYSNLDDRQMGEVIEELDNLGVQYRIENQSRVLVPKSDVFATRARLAQSGITGSAAPQGYELLDAEGLTVSDFRQRVDFKRAVEGELARTLMAMQPIDMAVVHLVIPEDELFMERQDPASASVLVDTTRRLNTDEVETITFLVSSAVEGLDPSNVTVADSDGNALNAPGDALGSASVSNRNMRMTREFEAALAADLTRLLDSAVGEGLASVAVHADLDFDEREIETQTFDGESQVALREETTDETFSGTGSVPGGVVGVDGGPLPTINEGSETEYTRNHAERDFGVDQSITRTRTAPGDIEKLSIAVVMDDGSLTGVTVPDTAEVERLVTAAAGIDAARGDTLAVSQVAFPAVEESALDGATAVGGMVDLIPQILGGVVLFGIALVLLMMARGKKEDGDEAAALAAAQAGLPVGDLGPIAALGAGASLEQPVPVGAGTAALTPGQAAELAPASVAELVERQPEEIALLLRSWLAGSEN